MRTLVRNVLAIIAGVVMGGFVNMAIVSLGPLVVPLPEGADMSDMDKLSESMKLFTPANFLFPFLAHALGTLCGAFIAAKLASTRPMALAIGVGLFFLVGGVMMVRMLPAPLWFEASDLLLAYVPMAYLGAKIARRKTSHPVGP